MKTSKKPQNGFDGTCSFSHRVVLRLTLPMALFILASWTPLFGNTAHTSPRGLTGLQMIVDMAPGINLFNTMDATDGEKHSLGSETSWGHPKTTLAMITAMKQKGFKTIRIPTTWRNHMGDAPDYLIDIDWMDRVEEVVNYAFSNDMYVILNIHHEEYSPKAPGSWICPTYEKQATCTAQLEKVWTQIATRFKDYGDFLIFETMNEPREKGSKKEWTGGSAENRAVVNAFNLAAANAIRKTGGQNKTRFLMVPQAAANYMAAVESLVIPNEDKNILVSMHLYGSFCLDVHGPMRWGTPEEQKLLASQIYSNTMPFIEKGIGVVIGEWGVIPKKNLPDRLEYYQTFSGAVFSNKVLSVAWIMDFDRKTLTWPNAIADTVIQFYK